MATRSILSFSPPRTRAVSWHDVWQRARTITRVRTTRRILAEMDDRLLADIGVSRSEAIVEANRPFWDVDGR